jgi:GT2 family glycosyltransferase
VNRKDDAFRDGPCAVDYVSGAAVLLARAALERTGLFDPDYVIYVEDVDWSARARAAGFTLWYEPAARGWHHVSATSGGGLTPLKAYFRLRSGALYLTRPHDRAARLPAHQGAEGDGNPRGRGLQQPVENLDDIGWAAGENHGHRKACTGRAHAGGRLPTSSSERKPLTDSNKGRLTTVLAPTNSYNKQRDR